MISATTLWRATMASNEASSGPTVEPLSWPISSIGKNPLGIAWKRTAVMTKVLRVIASTSFGTLTVRVSDGLASVTQTLNVRVEDDSPVVTDTTQSVQVNAQDTNVTLILDVSGSMSTIDPGASSSRLQIMQAAVTQMLDAYAALGDVRVRQAIIKAINRQQLVEAQYGAISKNNVAPHEGLCSKEQLGCGYTKDVPGYDPAGANIAATESRLRVAT